ncbi:MAG: hypothetical protein IJ814_07750 [Paludibacteraceae bacterium]|nr:hypothetical protein [Paludibacteraceae bacterium]
MENGFEPDLQSYKEHFDMLLSLTPQKGVSEVCHVVMDYDDFEEQMRVEVYPVAAVEWEQVLAMPVEIAPEVKASRAEIVARCIWNTAKYGFTYEQMHTMIDFIRRSNEKHNKNNPHLK